MEIRDESEQLLNMLYPRIYAIHMPFAKIFVVAFVRPPVIDLKE